MANNSKYGLQAGIFSNDQRNIDLAAQRLEFGGVIVNDAPIFRVDNMPYGGIKNRVSAGKACVTQWRK